MVDQPSTHSRARGRTKTPVGTAMCALNLIYHETFEPEISRIIQERMLVARYTKIRDVVGARAEMLAETDAEPPGAHHMLVILAERKIVHTLLQEFRELRNKKGYGLRGYITPVEDVF